MSLIPESKASALGTHSPKAKALDSKMSFIPESKASALGTHSSKLKLWTPKFQLRTGIIL
jgi:hypothetical protein